MREMTICVYDSRIRILLLYSATTVLPQALGEDDSDLVGGRSSTSAHKTMFKCYGVDDTNLSNTRRLQGDE